jgi:hypothetical protein
MSRMRSRVSARLTTRQRYCCHHFSILEVKVSQGGASYYRQYWMCLFQQVRKCRLHQHPFRQLKVRRAKKPLADNFGEGLKNSEQLQVHYRLPCISKSRCDTKTNRSVGNDKWKTTKIPSRICTYAHRNVVRTVEGES